MVSIKHLTLSLTLSVAVMAVAAHKDAHRHPHAHAPMEKRAVEVLTVTDVVWEYVTITRIGPKPTTFTILPSQTQGLQQPAAPVAAPAAQADAASVPAPAAPVAAASDPLMEAAVNAPAVQAPTVQDAPAVVAASDAQVPPPVAAPAAAGPAPIQPAPVAAAPAADQAQKEAVSSSSGSYAGDATYYNLGLTACGQVYTDSDFVAAISFPHFNRDAPSNPNNAPSCGKKIKVMRGSKSVVLTIRDKCEGCKMYDVDMSPAAFRELGSEGEGRFPITWDYL